MTHVWLGFFRAVKGLAVGFPTVKFRPVGDYRGDMSDHDEIRERIRRRLAELGMSDAELSKRIGKNDGWAHDYLRAKQPSPRRLPMETAMDIARALDLPSADLGVHTPHIVAHPRGMAEESNAEPWTPPAGHFLVPASQQITYYRMSDNSLDQDERRIRAGSILAFRLGGVRAPDLRLGDIVWCQTIDRDDPMRSLGSLVGMWIPPNKVASNSSGANWIYSTDDTEAKRQLIVRGVMMGVVAIDQAPARAGPTHRPSAPQ